MMLEDRNRRRMTRKRNGGTYWLEGVGRAMRVLDCFADGNPELRLTDLSQRLGITKTQALRIASTLEAGGYLQRDSETRRYRLGIAVFHLGAAVHNSMNLRHIAHRYLQRLVDATQETARLIVPHSSGPVCIDVVESQKGIRVFAQLGAKMPWNAGTSPKLILAYLPEEERERILTRRPFKRYTKRTIVNARELRREVLSIRGQDFYYCDGDLDEDAFGVSAPIFNHAGRIIGTVNVSGPSSRCSKAEVDRFIQLVRTAGAEISRELGYRPAALVMAAGERSD
jgi:IclR family transcriptional regulator, KDG regulon repressor